MEKKQPLMIRRLLSLFALLTPMLLVGQNYPLPLSLGETIWLAGQENLSLAIAREEVESARAEEQQLNALWYPAMAITGEYSHSLTEIAAVSTLGEIGSELLGNVGSLVGNIPAIEELVEGIADSQIRLPLVPRNTAEVGAEMSWVVFSGGRRVAATRIARQMQSLAGERLVATENAVVAEVVATYFGVELALQAVEVRHRSALLFGEHLRQAQKLEAEGMINRAERLTAEVAHKQSLTLLASSEGDLRVAQKALASLLAIDSLVVTPTTPLRLPPTLPSRDELLAEVENSPTIVALTNAQDIATQQLTIERSRYFPAIALLGHQQLWSSGLDKNLFPRTFVGVGVSWTLFDGLAREGAISQSKSTIRSIEATQEKTLRELQTAVDKHYSTITTLLHEHSAQQTTLTLAEELLRMRQRAFAEGMATSTEVVDAVQMLSEAHLSMLATLYTIDTSLASLLMITGSTQNILDYFPNEIE